MRVSRTLELEDALDSTRLAMREKPEITYGITGERQHANRVRGVKSRSAHLAF
jgi:hypothetical protein